MLPLLRHPAIWFSALLSWFSLLWILSSLSGLPEIIPPSPIPHFDKVEHFGFFLGGGVLFAGCLLSLTPGPPAWPRIFGTALIALALIGVLDEYHQCFTPGRSGADPWDWLADVLGAAAGVLVFRAMFRRWL
ncbi:MAG: hypothetical protein RLZZ282_693 [Verrucomicrobiota bacterium]|jgi:VanZ family protein